MTTHPPTDCPHCRAALTKAERHAFGFYGCDLHGPFVYDPVGRIRELEAENARLRGAFLRYCADDPPHDARCAVYDAYQHGPCDCGVEALIGELQARIAAA